MKKTIAASLIAGLVQIAAPAGAGEVVTDDGSGFLSQADTIFAVLDRIEGDELTLHLLHTVMSRDAQVFMFVGDEVRATLLPLTPGGARRAACVTEIGGWGRKARLVRRDSNFPRPDCLAQVNEYNGVAGLPVDRIALDMVTTIRVNGDVTMDGPAAAPPSPPYCSHAADFLKKTWQPYKLNDDEKRYTRCDADGDPRPLEEAPCRLGTVQGTQWVLTDNHGRVIQASACEPEHDLK